MNARVIFRRVVAMGIAAFLGVTLVRGAPVPTPMLAPERAVVLDIAWMSPPKVLPEGTPTLASTAQSQLIDGVLRLESSSQAAGASFAWQLRYPVDIARWPIMVLRYRASNLAAGPVYQDHLVQLGMRNSQGQAGTVPAAVLGDIAQDGQVRELRRDLRASGADAVVESIAFTFHPARRSGMIDLFEIRFEAPPDAAAADRLPQDQLQFAVADENGNAVSGAQVRAGILERANWTATGTTDRTGQASLLVPLSRAPGDVLVDPVEAAVTKSGYTWQYIAPIMTPRSTPVQVALKAAQDQPAVAVAPMPMVTPAPVPVTEGPVVYQSFSEEVFYSPPTVYYQPLVVSGYGGYCPWWVPYQEWRRPWRRDGRRGDDAGRGPDHDGVGHDGVGPDGHGRDTRPNIGPTWPRPYNYLPLDPKNDRNRMPADRPTPGTTGRPGDIHRNDPTPVRPGQPPVRPQPNPQPNPQPRPTPPTQINPPYKMTPPHEVNPQPQPQPAPQPNTAPPTPPLRDSSQPPQIGAVREPARTAPSAAPQPRELPRQPQAQPQPQPAPPRESVRPTPAAPAPHPAPQPRPREMAPAPQPAPQPREAAPAPQPAPQPRPREMAPAPQPAPQPREAAPAPQPAPQPRPREMAPAPQPAPQPREAAPAPQPAPRAEPPRRADPPSPPPAPPQRPADRKPDDPDNPNNPKK